MDLETSLRRRKNVSLRLFSKEEKYWGWRDWANGRRNRRQLNRRTWISRVSIRLLRRVVGGSQVLISKRKVVAWMTVRSTTSSLLSWLSPWSRLSWSLSALGWSQIKGKYAIYVSEGLYIKVSGLLLSCCAIMTANLTQLETWSVRLILLECGSKWDICSQLSRSRL